MDRRGRTGQMVNLIDFDKKGMNDIVANEFKKGIPKKVPNVISASREKVVYAENVISIIQQIVTQMTADKTGSACY